MTEDEARTAQILKPLTESFLFAMKGSGVRPNDFVAAAITAAMVVIEQEHGRDQALAALWEFLQPTIDQWAPPSGASVEIK